MLTKRPWGLLDKCREPRWLIECDPWKLSKGLDLSWWSVHAELLWKHGRLFWSIDQNRGSSLSNASEWRLLIILQDWRRNQELFARQGAQIHHGKQLVSLLAWRLRWWHYLALRASKQPYHLIWAALVAPIQCLKRGSKLKRIDFQPRMVRRHHLRGLLNVPFKFLPRLPFAPYDRNRCKH